MTLSDTISLLILALLSAATLRNIVLVARATKRQSLLTDDVAGCCESLGFVGCSVICTGVSKMEQIEDLLSEEYDRFEVVVVMDSTLQSEAFREIVAHFRMIRVNATQTGELPSASIDALYRSRQRSFRRLILVDRRTSTTYDDLDAALSVASYGYVFPIGRNMRLCAHAIESVVIALAEPKNSGVELLYSATSGSYIFQREAIIRRGGFSPRMLHRRATFRRICLHLPLTFCSDDDKEQNLFRGLILFCVGTTLLIIESILLGWDIMVATAATVCFVLAAASYVARLNVPANCSVRMRLCHIKRIIGIFRPAKFII